ncbi:MAG: TolC family protein [Bacteroidetes bacterium]|nr:TolC family protein [Bacteroidota bacterium]
MKLKLRMYLLLLAIGVATFGVNAQEESTSFSLEKAQQFAMENSYVLHNTSQDIIIAQKKVWETISTGLPQVSGSANYNMFLKLPVSLLPGEFFGEPAGTYIPVKFGQDYNSNFGLNVSQVIFDGSYIVGVGSSQLYLNLSKQAHEKVEIDIRDAVTQAYYMVLISERYKIVMEENLVNTQKMYNETKIYYDNGFREEQDVSQVKIILKNAENEVLKANREISVAKVVLKYAMGYDLETEINLTSDLENFLLPLVARENSFNFESNNHIDYRLAHSNFQVSEKLLKLEKVTYMPRLSGFYNFSKTAYSNEANLIKNEWFPSSLVGFQLTMKLFNSGQKRSKVQQAKIELDKAKTQRKLAEITLQKDYLTASAEMESAIERYENDRENRELAKGILDKTKIKFKNGISGSSELSQIETQYINSFQALVASTMQLLQSDLKLKKAAGSL